MSEHGLYEVTGIREYRGHKPGETFEAKLDPAVEYRAIQRGAIRLIERITPEIRPGSYVLPDDWPPKPRAAPTTTEAPEGASLM